MLVLRDAHPGDPPLDIAVSHALLRRVAAGEQPATVRLYRPGPTLAFGRLDELAPGFAAACAAGRDHGFTPLRRLAGGRAAAYDEGSLIYEEIVPTGAGLQEMTERFDGATALLAGMLSALGADARIGAIPGEYCPGRHSISVAGRLKVVGAAQRVVRGGALLSAVLVVQRGDPVREVLIDAYRALDVPFAPSTAGALDDVIDGITVDGVADALLRALRAAGHALTDGTVDAPTRAAAQDLRGRHAVAATG